jgi:hypothetical protein
VRIAARYPYLPAKRPHRRAVHHALHDAGAGRDELPVILLDPLEDDVGHPLMVAVERRIGPRRYNSGLGHKARLASGRTGKAGRDARPGVFILTMARCWRLVISAASAGALLGLGGLVVSAAPAHAAAPCSTLLGQPILCPTPPTTRPPATTATTRTPATTKAPATTKTAATTKPATTIARAVTPVIGVGPSAASLPVGLDQVPAPSADAPQLAGTPPAGPGPTLPVADPGAPSGVAAVTGPASAGLPDHHAPIRILLSLLTIVIAAVAVAQLPASRRLLHREPAADAATLTPQP